MFTNLNGQAPVIVSHLHELDPVHVSGLSEQAKLKSTLANIADRYVQPARQSATRELGESEIHHYLNESPSALAGEQVDDYAGLAQSTINGEDTSTHTRAAFAEFVS